MSEKYQIGVRIRNARIAQGYNRSQVARIIDVTPQAVQQWEEGVTSPRGNNLRKLADCLNQTPQYLQFGDEYLKVEENKGYLKLPKFVDHESFSSAYKASIEYMLNLACQFDWIDVKENIDVSMIADIGLSHLQKHDLLPFSDEASTKAIGESIAVLGSSRDIEHEPVNDASTNVLTFDEDKSTQLPDKSRK